MAWAAGVILRQEHGLTWLDRTKVQEAVAKGRRAASPALEGAAHERAARALNGSLPVPGPGPAVIIVIGVSSASAAASAQRGRTGDHETGG
jgi:hypothetical protein